MKQGPKSKNPDNALNGSKQTNYFDIYYILYSYILQKKVINFKEFEF